MLLELTVAPQRLHTTTASTLRRPHDHSTRRTHPHSCRQASGPPGAALSAGLPDAMRRQLVWWLGGCAGWVFSMVVLGGVTRLTRSGLSMTDWKLTGEWGRGGGWWWVFKECWGHEGVRMRSPRRKTCPWQRVGAGPWRSTIRHALHPQSPAPRPNAAPPPRPCPGERPPLTQADWEAEFSKYRASPEFRLAHSHMGVEDFKFIFWMEYAHRMWGRLLGLGFALPAAYFAVRGAINAPLAARLGLLFAMGGAQGLVGWWMVRSGLEVSAEPARAGARGRRLARCLATQSSRLLHQHPAEVLRFYGACTSLCTIQQLKKPCALHLFATHLKPALARSHPLTRTRHVAAVAPVAPQEPENKHAVPRVSPYRLAAHLTSAFAIYATLVWTTLSLASPAPALAAAAPAAAAAAAALRRRALPAACLIGVTAVSGAFVAGMDAGRAFNTFPLMSGQWVPDEYWSGLPPLRNAFENTAAVQLHHRALALTTLATVLALWAGARGAPLPAAARAWLGGLAAATAAQVTLGVTTLLTYVPAPLGAAHQAGAMVLFTAALGLLHSLRPAVASPIAKTVSRAAPPLGLAATAAIGYAVTQMR